MARRCSRRSGDVRRFDEVAGEFETPALAKIDVQGAELMVLRGMGKLLERLDVLIIEASLIATISGAPEFGEVMHWMSAAGFSLYDIVDLRRRPLDSALGQLDAVFVPRDSVLRRDRRWRDRL